MSLLAYFKAWVTTRFQLDERGCAALEYVLVILGVVLFLVFAAFALQGVLNGAVTKISNWIGSVNPPPP